jgi:hypothetical protein
MSEYNTYRNDYSSAKDKIHGKKLKPIYKRIKPEKLYLLVKAYILNLDKEDTIFAEDVANLFQVKKHEIKEVFKKLNQDGILSQGSNRPPHDGQRNRSMIGWGFDNSWIATRYHIRNEKSKDE